MLLHGFLGSGESWGAEFDQLGARHRLIVPDLLGFGDSPKPPSGYSLGEHADALRRLLGELGIHEPVLLVGHSFGSVVALRAAAVPGLASGVVAFGPPIYPDARQARRRIAAGDPMGGMFLLDSPIARRSCIWFHEHPVASATLVRLWRPDLPAPVARDAARHTWASYSGTLEGLLQGVGAPAMLDAFSGPVRFVIGDEDGVADRAYLSRLARGDRGTSLRVVSGTGHDLPLTHPKLCRQEIEALASRAGRPP